MRKAMPLKIDPVLLREAGKRTKAENRMLYEYVETVLRRDLARKLRKAKKPMIELRGPIPPDIRKWKSVPIPGETKRQRKEREKLVHTILDLGRIPR